MIRAPPHAWRLPAFSPHHTEAAGGESRMSLRDPCPRKMTSLIQLPQLSPRPILGENLYGSHFSSSFFFSASSSSSSSHLAFLFNISPLVSSDRPHVSESSFWHQTMFISCFSRLCEKKVGVCLTPPLGEPPLSMGVCHWGMLPVLQSILNRTIIMDCGLGL